jgi:choline dehydrogenase-like flavoprotein
MKNKTPVICVVGTGIGGGTLIKKLSEKNVNIVAVEAGDNSKNSNNVTFENSGRDFGIRSTNSIQIGGTSNLWHGVLAPLDECDFVAKSHIQNSGWCIKLKDLESYYKEASKILGLDSYPLFNIRNFPSRLKERIADVCFNNNFLKNKIFQQPIPAHNFKRDINLLNKLNSKVTLHKDSTVLELVHENNSIKTIKVGKRDGSIINIKADIFIVSAGALETPRLLLNSKIDNDNIGRYLMDHPMGNLCQMEFKHSCNAPLYSDLKIKAKQKIKSGFVLNLDARNKHQLLNHCFYLRPSFVKGINNESEKIKLSLLAFKDGGIKFKDVWNVLTNLNVVKQILIYKFSLNVKFKYADIFIVSEQSPNPRSRVSLSREVDRWGYRKAKVNWKVLTEDVEDMQKWYKMIQTEFFCSDKYKFANNVNHLNWNDSFTSAAHHLGTARMSNSSSSGVVDKNLKVFGFDNLYVCDGSVFPTSGNVNSSFTISALACRLADHLIKGNK